MVFPSYSKVFSNLTSKTPILILKTYKTPDKILAAPKDEVVSLIAINSRKGLEYANEKYNKLVEAAKLSKSFGRYLESAFDIIQMNIEFIQLYNNKIDSILSSIKDFTLKHEDHEFIKQIHLLDTIKGVGFISAVTLMCEIGDFSAFKKLKQLYAYFGLDPAVKESGKFKSSKVSISKRGSRIASRVLFTIALVSVRSSKNGQANNPVLKDYYDKKKESKPKMVAIGAVMHKVSNIIFAVLRDNKPFVLRTAKEHEIAYKPNLTLIA